MARKTKQPKAVSASEAFRRLKAGNRRFTANASRVGATLTQSVRESLARTAQTPFAVILCCSDSRAPVELIFDQGLGDLFVVRVAGNIIAPSLVGSVEFACATFGTQLVVVMGHTGCGAVSATLDFVGKGQKAASQNIHDIIQRILPHVVGLKKRGVPRQKLMEAAVRSNIHASVSQLAHGSRILEDLTRKGKLTIVGAEYCLESGKVEFFQEVRK